VVAAACSESAPLGFVKRHSYGSVHAGTSAFFRKEIVDSGFFEVYGLKPLAGRLFLADRAADANAVIINATAVSRFGFPSSSAAIGQFLTLGDDSEAASQIVGVIPDFPLETVRSPIEATARLYWLPGLRSAHRRFASLPCDPSHRCVMSKIGRCCVP